MMLPDICSQFLTLRTFETQLRSTFFPFVSSVSYFYGREICNKDKEHIFPYSPEDIWRSVDTAPYGAGLSVVILQVRGQTPTTPSKYWASAGPSNPLGVWPAFLKAGLMLPGLRKLINLIELCNSGQTLRTAWALTVRLLLQTCSIYNNFTEESSEPSSCFWSTREGCKNGSELRLV